MSTGHSKDAPSPDQFLAKLIEMEALVERQMAALNALELERDHFKGAFEEADAACHLSVGWKAVDVAKRYVIQGFRLWWNRNVPRGQY
jgi:hypothetical protein